MNRQPRRHLRITRSKDGACRSRLRPLAAQSVGQLVRGNWVKASRQPLIDLDVWDAAGMLSLSDDMRK